MKIIETKVLADSHPVSLPKFKLLGYLNALILYSSIYKYQVTYQLVKQKEKTLELKSHPCIFNLNRTQTILSYFFIYEVIVYLNRLIIGELANIKNLVSFIINLLFLSTLSCFLAACNNSIGLVLSKKLLRLQKKQSKMNMLIRTALSIKKVFPFKLERFIYS